jgi:Snf7
MSKCAHCLTLAARVDAPSQATLRAQSMAAMNKRMNIPALARIMKEFERQNARMDQADEMMGDAMDDVFEVRLGKAEHLQLRLPSSQAQCQLDTADSALAIG